MSSWTRTHRSIEIPIEDIVLRGDLRIPFESYGLVLFSHPSGSSYLSPHNRYLAQKLNNYGLATCLFDLLTADEEKRDKPDGELRYNVPLLAERLTAVTSWVRKQDDLSHLPFGYFGVSTGTAAAMTASLAQPVHAIVSRSGRPDLAAQEFREIHTPTLFVAGENDPLIIRLTRDTMQQMQAETEIQIIPNTGHHLVEEPETADELAHGAANWFLTHMREPVESSTGIGVANETKLYEPHGME